MRHIFSDNGDVQNRCHLHSSEIGKTRVMNWKSTSKLMERKAEYTRRCVIPFSPLRLHVHPKYSSRQPSGPRGQYLPFHGESESERYVCVSVRVLQRSKSIHKIVHANVSLRHTTTNRASPLTLLLFLPLLGDPTPHQSSQVRAEHSVAQTPGAILRSASRFPPFKLLFLPCAEMGFVAFGSVLHPIDVRPVGLDVEYVGFESEWVDELEGRKEEKGRVSR